MVIYRNEFLTLLISKFSNVDLREDYYLQYCGQFYFRRVYSRNSGWRFEGKKVYAIDPCHACFSSCLLKVI